MPTARRRRGLTLVDLMIVVAILVLLTGSVVPSLACRSRETAHRVRCASNLRALGQALLLYANENRGALPRVRFDPAAPPTAYTGSSTQGGPFAADGPAANDVSASWHLLIVTQDIAPEVLTCPSMHTKPWRPKQPRTTYGNLPSGDHLDYSIHNFYAEPALSLSPGSVYQPSARFPLAADINPGTPQLLTLTPQSSPQAIRAGGNSPNHTGDGQNIVFGDGHVSFENTPFVGIDRDNIYTYGVSGKRMPTSGGTGLVGAPVDLDDSVLLPLSMARAPRIAGMDSSTATWMGLGLLVIAGAAMALIGILRRGVRADRD